MQVHVSIHKKKFKCCHLTVACLELLASPSWVIVGGASDRGNAVFPALSIVGNGFGVMTRKFHEIPLTSIFTYGPERFWCTESPISNQVGADHHSKRPVPYTWNFDKHIRQATVTKAVDHVLVGRVTNTMDYSFLLLFLH